MKLLKKRLPCLIMCFVVLFALSSCQKNDINKPRKLTAVATTTMLYDLVKQIGGDLVEAYGLMGSGVDPHQYRATAGDIDKMQKADVVIYSGLHLEGKMGDVFAALQSSKKAVICASDGISKDLIIYNDGIPDPHFWFDVSLWKMAAQQVEKGLSQADKANENIYKQNLNEYEKQLDQLDGYIRAKTMEIPDRQRVLITAHDAFGYFGKAYGYTVKGLQGINTSAEAATSDVSSLAEFIADNKIKGVFIESSLPVKNIEALMQAVKAKGFETSLGGLLYSDSTGDAANGTDTYIGAFKHNAEVITSALKQ